MPLVDLDDPAELRARWSALAAVAHATGFDRRWYADADGWYHQDETGSDLRMVRLDGARAVLFGFHTQHSSTAGADLLAGSPEWIGQPEVKTRMAAGQLGFVYGSFNGTWARAAYPGDPWQPLDDGFAPIAQWVTSDEDAARELIEWAAEWADYLGGLDELLPVGVALIRTAASGGLTGDVLRDLFSRLGIGPRSPQDPDLRAALVAAMAFGDGIVAEGAVNADNLGRSGRMSAGYTAASFAEPPSTGPGGFGEAGGFATETTGFVEPVEDEESFYVPPGVSPFTGMPIDDGDQMIGEPFVPEPAITPEPPFPAEPPLQPDPPFTPEPPPYQPDPEPRREPDNYGVTGKKPRRFGRKKKHEEDDGDALAVLGLVGPQPVEQDPSGDDQYGAPGEHQGEYGPVEPGQGEYAPAEYDEGQPGQALHQPGRDQYEQGQRGQDQFQQGQPGQSPYGEPGPAQYAQPQYQQAPYGHYQDDGDTQPTPEQYLSDRRLPATEPPRVGGPVEDGEDFYASLFADAPAAASYTPDVPTDVAPDWSSDTPSPFTPLTNTPAPDADDTGVLPPIEEPPTAGHPSPFAPTAPTDADEAAPEWPPSHPETPAPQPAPNSPFVPAAAQSDQLSSASPFAPAGAQADWLPVASPFAPTAGADQADDDAPTAEIEAVVDADANSADEAPAGSGEQLNGRADAHGIDAGMQVSDGDGDGDVAQAGGADVAQAGGGDGDTGAGQVEGADGDTGVEHVEGSDIGVRAVDADLAAEDRGGDAEVTAGLVAVGDDEDEYYPSDVSPFAQTSEQSDGDDYERPLLTNGFRPIDPADLQPGEHGYEYAGEVFHDELIGDGDWTADQLGDPTPNTHPTTSHNTHSNAHPKPASDADLTTEPTSASDADLTTQGPFHPTAEPQMPVAADAQPHPATSDEQSTAGGSAADHVELDSSVASNGQSTNGSVASNGQPTNGSVASNGQATKGLVGDGGVDRSAGADGFGADDAWSAGSDTSDVEVTAQIEAVRDDVPDGLSAEHPAERFPEADRQFDPRDDEQHDALDRPREDQFGGLSSAPDGAQEQQVDELYGVGDGAQERQDERYDALNGAVEEQADGRQFGALGGGREQDARLDAEEEVEQSRAEWVGQAEGLVEVESADSDITASMPAVGSAESEDARAEAEHGAAGPERGAAGSEYEPGGAELGAGGSEYEPGGAEGGSGGAEFEGAEVERLVAPPASSGGVAIPGLGVVADGPRVEPLPGSIEEAMRAEYERPRPRPKESAALEALREWCRARTKVVPSGFTIQVQVLDPEHPSYRFDLEPPEIDDPQYGADRLADLLADLWSAESQSEQGAWLFARLDAAGRTLRIDRWYDQVPDWWDHPIEQRLDVHGLVRRLNGRGPDWQPSYLEKLYTTAR